MEICCARDDRPSICSCPWRRCELGDPVYIPLLDVSDSRQQEGVRLVQYNETSQCLRRRTSGDSGRTGLLDLERSGDGDLAFGDGERSRGERSMGEPPPAPLTGEPTGLTLRDILQQSR